MRYNELLKEDEYGRDQGELNEPQFANSEDEFFQIIEEFSGPREQGEGTGIDIIIKKNLVYHGHRKMGTLSTRGNDMVVMHGDYGQGTELIGAIVKSPQGFDVFFYKPGYSGTNTDLESAIDTLIIAAWG